MEKCELMEGDKYYVLCEFVNECVADEDGLDKPVQVAWTNWIKFDPNERRPIADIIKDGTQVLLQWPTNREVKPKEVMIKKMGGIEWTDVIAILKGQSDEWPEIVQASKNLIKYGEPFPPREDRKNVVKRLSDADSQTSVPEGNTTNKRKAEDHSSGGKTTEKKQKTRVEKKATKTKDESVSSQAIETKIKSKESVSIDSGSEEDLPLLIAKKKVYVPKYESHMESSDSQSDVEDWERNATESTLREKLSLLKVENRRLRKDLAAYKAMKSVADDFPKVAPEFSKLAGRMKELTSQSLSSSRHESKSSSSSRHSSSSSGHHHHRPSSRTHSATENSLSTSHSPKNALQRVPSNRSSGTLLKDVTNLASSNDSKIGCPAPIAPAIVPATSNHDASKIAPSPPASDSTNGEEKSRREQETDDSKIDIEDHPLLAAALKTDLPEVKTEPEEFIYFGSKAVPKNQISKLRHKKGTILAAELCALVFSAEDLALSTLTGKKNNKYDDGLEAVKLDEKRVRSIIDYVVKVKNEHGEDFEKNLVTAIGNKINNFKKTDERKALREKEKARIRERVAVAAGAVAAGAVQEATA